MRRLLAPMLFAVAVAACANDGTNLTPPPPGATAPPLTSTTLKTTTSTPIALTLASPGFVEEGPVPIENTCDGENASPPLTWGSVPEGTVELALTVIDTDANGFVHWVIAAIDPGVQAINISDVPEGAIEGLNDSGTLGWIGPCPPKGSGPHHYVFTLYALTANTAITPTMSPTAAITAIESIPGVTALLTGVYERGA